MPPVDDMGAARLASRRPGDVVRFVEMRLQSRPRTATCSLFSAAFDQRTQEQGSRREAPVERQLDRQHLGIVGRSSWMKRDRVVRPRTGGAGARPIFLMTSKIGASRTRSAAGTDRRQRLDAQLGPRPSSFSSAAEILQPQRRGHAIDVRPASTLSAVGQQLLDLRRRRSPTARGARSAPSLAAPQLLLDRAAPRSSDSSSSTRRSELRVTRKRAVWRTSQPGNRSPTYAEMTSPSSANAPAYLAPDGSRTSRPSTIGTCTTASSCSCGTRMRRRPCDLDEDDRDVERAVAQVRERMARDRLRQRRQRREDAHRGSGCARQRRAARAWKAVGR